jgi:hypothetical protein
VNDVYRVDIFHACNERHIALKESKESSFLDYFRFRLVLEEGEERRIRSGGGRRRLCSCFVE